MSELVKNHGCAWVRICLENPDVRQKCTRACPAHHCALHTIHVAAALVRALCQCCVNVQSALPLTPRKSRIS